MLRLALPLVMAEVGWMFMGVVDTVMVGHLPHPAVTISAAALGQVLYNTLAFGIGGVLLGLDTYISQAHGAGDLDDANKWLLSGVVLAVGLSAVLMGMVWVGPIAMVRIPVGGGETGRRCRLHWHGFIWRRLWGRRCGGWIGGIGMGCGRPSIRRLGRWIGHGCGSWCGWAGR